MAVEEAFDRYLTDSQEVLKHLGTLRPQVASAAGLLVAALKNGHKILACGNGGSAADAQHFVAELVVRFEKDRPGLPAVALTTDTSVLTACANDFSFEEIFSRQVQALGQRGDVLVAISTSGNSPNVLRSVSMAKEQGMRVIAMTGQGGGALSEAGVDVLLAVPVKRTALVQQGHEIFLHFLCEAVDTALASNTSPQ